MGAHFEHDFGSVRVHRGAAAHRAAESVGAYAFTTGQHVVVNDARVAFSSSAGRRVLAHELAHVVQQSSGQVAGHLVEGDLRVSDPHDHFEQEADSAATAITGDKPKGLGLTSAGVASTATGRASDAGPYVQRFPWALAGGAGAVGGAAYLLWLHHCLDPLNRPMNVETGRWLDAYNRDTGRPVPSRMWDAFGHCWVACAGTERCGATGTAIAGKSREFYREFIGGGPHDSYQQDTNNQTIGRGFGSQGLDCYTACDSAIRGGRLDLSAPDSDCYDRGTTYQAPCEPPAVTVSPPSTVPPPTVDAGAPTATGAGVPAAVP